MENPAQDGSASRLRHVVVCGAGLAGQLTAAALAKQLPKHIQVTWLKASGTDTRDFLYGSVTAPMAYDFNLSAGVTEPDLVLNSSTVFSFGTHYVGWGGARRNWVQGFHVPFSVLEGVPLYHYLLQRGLFDIEPFVVSAVAGLAGKFAHPPEDQRHPLSRAEYGYQFDPVSYGALFERQAKASVKMVSGKIVEIDRTGDKIGALRLADGQRIEADLYIDCSGPDALLSSQPHGHTGRRLGVVTSQGLAAELGPPLRTVTAEDFGWSSHTPLLDAVRHLTVYAPDCEDEALAAHGETPELCSMLDLGHRDQAWVGNCVAIGLSAGAVEPITCAPSILLQRDIERLLALVPVRTDMAVERREFNRQYVEDYRNAELFNRSLFVGSMPDEPYWRTASAEPLDERLASKIEQFESRGLHVAYDLEPFSLEDWILQHFGMGRRPDRYDRIADHVPRDTINAHLAGLRGAIDQVVKTMPPHAVYRQNLANFLRQEEAQS